MTDSLQNTILATLLPYQPQRISLFGSYARGEERADSDLDILISLRLPIDLIDLIRIEAELTEKLGISAHVMTEKTIKNPILKASIMRDLQVIYES